MYIGSIIVAALFMLYLVFKIRSKNTNVKNTYLLTKKQRKRSTEKETISILKSKENIVHTIAFLTILSCISVSVAVSIQTPAIFVVTGTLILLLIGSMLFITINTLVWCLVQKHWYKQEKGNRNAR